MWLKPWGNVARRLCGSGGLKERKAINHRPVLFGLVHPFERFLVRLLSHGTGDQVLKACDIGVGFSLVPIYMEMLQHPVRVFSSTNSLRYRIQACFALVFFVLMSRRG